MRGVEALKLTFERGILSDGTASRVAHVLACAMQKVTCVTRGGRRLGTRGGTRPSAHDGLRPCMGGDTGPCVCGARTHAWHMDGGTCGARTVACAAHERCDSV